MADVAEPLLTGTVSAATLGRLVGLSPRRVRELAERGILERPGGRYRLPDAVLSYCAHLREVAAGRGSSGEGADGEVLDLVQERAHLARRQREAVELKLSRERGELVDAREVTMGYIRLATAARNRLLAVPRAAKGYIPHLTVDEVERLEDLVVRALQDVASGDAERAAEGSL